MNAVDFFCGAGGLSLGFHRAGARIVLAVEKDIHAAASYRESFVRRYSPKTVVVCDDVSSDAVGDAIDTAIDSAGRIDLVLGGPPCQDFSLARLKRRRKGSRATLVHRYFDLIGQLRPRAFVFENVPSITTAGGGRYWLAARKAADELGYNLHWEIVDAADFGVPQHRRRLFVVGMRKNIHGFAFPAGEETPRTVRDVIGKLPRLAAGQQASGDAMHRARRHSADTVEFLRRIPAGGGWRDATDHRILDCHKDHNGHYDVYGRVRFDEPAPTITGGCTNPSKGRFIHPTANRGLTVREAALLQTFPKRWRFAGGIESQSLQVGNAVPVDLAHAIGTAVVDTLLKARARGASKVSLSVAPRRSRNLHPPGRDVHRRSE